ncbi:DUF4307 domain-containing protein [Leucobacter denitrificans]|uniref:DUF4307 domain-containing protein n=1 Tax=Leucobacter denitrificans TaxID=683042 RepID=A0A7G9S408_9MICO|nr:DUF4307 domain-containing protein [Leucobacter denitrificans]QNN62583.1 DUF4307 domain-containing protein [Leucobacter denitrificans]
MTEASRETVADRYGTRRSRRFDRRIGWAVGGAAVVIGALVIGFGSWQQDTLEVKNIGFSLNKDQAESGIYTATTRFEVNTDPGVRVSCAVEALNTSKATVGWKVVDLPVIDTRSQDVTVNVITIGPATAVNAKSCWPVEL